MDDNKEVSKLLKNIQKGLDLYSVEELNKALTQVLKSSHNKSGEIKYTLDIVCSRFGISKNKLTRSSCRGEVELARRTSYCLLYIDVGLQMGYISNKIFYRDISSISKGVKYLYECEGSRVPIEIEFVKRYKELKIELINFINKQK